MPEETLGELIRRAIDLKKDDKEFALFYYGEGYGWAVSIGNENRYVRLGEVDGEFNISGESHETAEDVVSKLIKLLVEADDANTRS